MTAPNLEAMDALRQRGDFLGYWLRHREVYPDATVDSVTIANRDRLIAGYERDAGA